MAADQKATESSKAAAPLVDVTRDVDTTTGEVAENVWEVPARFVGFQAPRAWSMADERGGTRAGTTYRVDVRVPEGTVLMKVPENVYQDMVAARLDFGDRIAVIYGRTVSGGEMRVAPVGFRRA